MPYSLWSNCRASSDTRARLATTNAENEATLPRTQSCEQLACMPAMNV